MLILPVQEARPGIKLAMPVTHPEQPDQDLLKAGFVLTVPVIKRLCEMGIDFIYADYPDLNDLDRHLMPLLSPARQLIYSQIKNTMAAVERSAKPTVAFPAYYEATRELITTLLQQGEHAIYLDRISSRLGTDAVAHATAVAHLSLLMGLRLEQYLIAQRRRLPAHHAREVVNLGVAGMLHDIGKSRLSRGLRDYSGVNTPTDSAVRSEWETHPQVGYEMVRHGVEPSAAAAIVQHHQHFDGSGFPVARQRDGGRQPLQGSNIHIFARILQAADLYDCLTIGSEGRRPNVEILHLLGTRYAGWLDPQVAKVLAAVIPPFPPGSKVELSDNTVAVVTKMDPSRPYQPTVRRLADDKWSLAGDEIDLAAVTDVEIISVGGHSIDGMIPREQPVDNVAVA